MATKKKKAKKSKYAPIRHPFLYKVEYPNGDVKVAKAMAKVVKAKVPVTIVLTAAHVRELMRKDGIGNTATCSAAVCTYKHAEAFRHAVAGYTDWTYTRAYIASKLNKQGLPTECYVYEHNNDDVARLNDTKNGQKKLLKIIEKDGPITVVLTPYRKRSAVGRSGRDRPTTGARSVETRAKGAKLRMIESIRLGALPDPRSL